MSAMIVLLLARNISSAPLTPRHAGRCSLGSHANAATVHGILCQPRQAPSAHDPHGERMETYWGISQTIEHHPLSSCSLEPNVPAQGRGPNRDLSRSL